MKELDKAQAEHITGAAPRKRPDVTTLAVGEEGGCATTLAIGEEGGVATTLAVGEEGPIFTTLAIGEEGGGKGAASGATGAFGSF